MGAVIIAERKFLFVSLNYRRYIIRKYFFSDVRRRYHLHVSYSINNSQIFCSGVAETQIIFKHIFKISSVIKIIDDDSFLIKIGFFTLAKSKYSQIKSVALR